MKMNVKTMTVIAMLAVLAFLAVLVCRIPLVLFLEYEPKNVILTIGGFIFGPVVSLLVTVVVALVELVTVSKDGGWGLLMNILASGSFAGIAALIYQKKRTLGGAAIGLISGIAASTALMIVWNYLIAPLYMGMPRADVAKLLVPAFLPFNLIKGALNAALVLADGVLFLSPMAALILLGVVDGGYLFGLLFELIRAAMRRPLFYERLSRTRLVSTLPVPEKK